MRRFGDHDATRDAIYSNAMEAFQALPPVENSRYRMTFSDPGWAGPAVPSVADHKAALLTGRTLGRRLTATVGLVDKASGATVDSRRMTVASVPQLSRQGTFVIDGNPSALSHQLRLLPGAFVRRKASGETSTHFNFLPGQGVPHQVVMDPATGVFRTHVGQAEIPTVTLLRAFGATDDDLKKYWGDWGPEIVAANLRADKPHHLARYWEKFGAPGPPPPDLAQALAARLSGYKMDPWVTRRTLGHPHAAYGKLPLLAATRKMIAVNRGEADPDDRDNPAYSAVWGPEHLIAERIARAGPHLAKHLWQVTNAGSLKRLQPGFLTPAVRGVFTHSGLALQPEGVSAAEYVDHGARITKVGEGGIGKSAESVPMSARAVSPGQFPFIDSIRTSECFDAETEVFTARGWLKWPDVNEADELACWVAADVVEFHRPEKLVAYTHDGPLYGVKDKFLNYLVTPNHRMWVRPSSGRLSGSYHTLDYSEDGWRFETADEVNTRPYRQFVSSRTPIAGDETQTHFTLGGERYAIEDWAELVGWITTEGHVTIYRGEQIGGRRITQYRVRIAQSVAVNPTNTERISSLLSRLGFNASYHAGSSQTFVFYSKSIAEYFVQFGTKANNKRLPDVCFGWPLAARRRLFDALVAGDGCTRASGFIRYGSASGVLVEQLLRLATSLGISSRRATTRPPARPGYSPYHVCSLFPNRSVFVVARDTATRRTKYVVPYVGTVYCATVVGGRLLVRRGGGVPIWTGNSESVGVDLRVAFGTRLGSDKNIYAPLLDGRTGKLVFKSPRDLADATVAFPGALQSGDPVVPAVRGGRLTHVPRHEVDYHVPSMEQSFSPLTNMVPIKSASKPHRSSMGARMISQSLPLTAAEAPLVRTQVPNQPGRSFEELFGRHMGAVFARADQPGVVESVAPAGVVVRYADGRRETHELYDNHPSGRKTALTNEPLVRPGQQVLPGQILAKSNYTDHAGTAAYGKNLRTAFMIHSSVTADTPVLWYDGDGQPHYTLIAAVPVAAQRGVSMDMTTLTVGQSPLTRCWDHPASGNVVEVRTDTGRVVRATTCHSFVTLDDEMGVVSVPAGDLKPNLSWLPRAGLVDLPVTAAHITMPGSAALPAVTLSLDEDLGFVCGLYAAEGCQNGTGVDIAVGDGVLRADLLRRLSRIVPWTRPVVRTRNVQTKAGRAAVSTVVRVSCVRLMYWLDRVCGHLAADKQVPDFIFGAPLACRRGFVAGYWAGDGRVHLRPDGKCKDTDTVTTSRKLRDGLGLLLASLGVSTTHGEYRDDAYTHGVVYRLGVSTRDTHKLPAFAHTDKWSRLQGLTACYRGGGFGKGVGTADMVPVSHSTRRLLRRLACARYGSASDLYARLSRTVVGSACVARRDVLDLVQQDEPQPSLQRLRRLAESTVEWDRVVSVTPVEYVGQVYDLDMGDRRTFMCLDTMIVHNSTYEDSIGVSASAAEKLRSDHLYRHTVQAAPDVVFGREAHAAAFPGKHPLSVLKQFGADGVIKPGAVVNHGDPLILAVRRKAGDYGRLSRSGKAALSDASETWEHEEPGVVTDVVQTRFGPSVVVKTTKRLQDGDKLCYDPETEILTVEGWKPVAAVTPTDTVASLDAGGRLEYLQPTSVHAYPYSGRMYCLDTTQVSLRVTPDHHLLARPRNQDGFRLLKAEELYAKRFELKADAEWVGDEPKEFELPGSSYTRAVGRGGKGTKVVPPEVMKTETYLLLLGAFLTDGYTIYDPKAGNYGLGISQVKPDHRDRLRAALTAAGVKFVERPERFLVYSRGLAEHLRPYGKTATKYVPPYVFGWSPRLIRVLLDWLNWGNGSLGGSTWSFSTGSCRLVGDYQRLCLHAGWASHVKLCPAADKPDTVKGVPVKTKSDSYQVYIYRHKLTPEINHGHAATQGGQHERWEDYTGTVYCVTLPRNHTLYVRRNGKTIWSGNSGRHGNKGVVVITPDDEMPRDAQGRPVEVIISSLGTISRTNPSAIFEAHLGKIAEKTGKPYVFDDFAHGRDVGDYVRGEAARHGVPFMETLTDPKTGRPIPNVGVGMLYVMKLHHLSAGKAKGRGLGGYDESGQPLRGQSGKAMRASMGDTNALVSHGASKVLHDAHIFRGQDNPEFWASYMAGFPPVKPHVSKPFERFLSELRAAGIDPVHKDGRYHLTALTDEAVRRYAGDREVTSGETLDLSRDGRPVEGGLHDPKIFGTTDSQTQWGKVTLHEPVVSPVFEEPVRRLLGLTGRQFRDVVSGKHALPSGATGMAGLVAALRAYDVPGELAKARRAVESTRKTVRDDAARRLKYLAAMERTGTTPADWVTSAVPVLPPGYRPVNPGRGGGGCFNRSTLVWTDRGMTRIDQIVNERLQCLVWSYNWDARRFELKPVTGWFRNQVPGLIGVCTPMARGRLATTAGVFRPEVTWGTADHQVYTPAGSTCDLQHADRLLAAREVLTETQRQVVYGTLLGAGHVSPNGAYYCVHGKDQKGYAALKCDLLGALVPGGTKPRSYVPRGSNTKQIGAGFSGVVHVETREARAECYTGPKNAKRVTEKWLAQVGELGLALWYFDDGEAYYDRSVPMAKFSTQCFSRECIALLRSWLECRWGLPTLTMRWSAQYRDRDLGWQLVLRGESVLRLLDLVAPYACPDVAYKLLLQTPPAVTCNHCDVRLPVRVHRRPLCENCFAKLPATTGTANLRKSRHRSTTASQYTAEQAAVDARHRERVSTVGSALPALRSLPTTASFALVEVGVTGYASNSANQRIRTGYDITVADNHNYFANGFLVANSGNSNVLISDQNLVYADLINANHALRDLSKEVDDVGAERLNLYDAVAAAYGLGDPVGAKNRERGVRGVLARLLGDSGKHSFMQQKLLGTPVNLSGRAAALPDMDLDMDQIGVPHSVAWDVYHPFVVRRLVRSGVPRVEAVRQVADRAPAALRALQAEMGVRPILATRYPALHRYAVQAFRPTLAAGDAVMMNHLVTKSYGGDFDGDTYTLSVPLTDEAVAEAYEKMLPSKNLFSPAGRNVLPFLPNMEVVQGHHALTTGDERNAPVEFRTLREARAAEAAGLIGLHTRVRILEDG